MPWSAPTFTGGVVWEDAPSQNTPLNAADLNTEENAEAAYAAQVGQSVANYVDAETARATAAEALKLAKASNLSDVADADSSRANLKVPVLRHAQCVSTTNRALSGALPTIDGYAVQDGDRVLLVGQTTASQNGPWIAHVAGWVRPNDYPTGGVLTSRSCKVTGGTVYGATDWLLASTVNVTVDTTAATWKQLQPPPSVVTDQRLWSGPPDYIIENNAGTYEAFNTSTHQVQFSGVDPSAVMQSVLTALGTAGGYVYWAGQGTVVWGQSGSTAPVIPAGIGGFGTTPAARLRIAAAPGITLQLTQYTQCLFRVPSLSPGAYQTIQNVDLEDLTVDAGGTTAQNAAGFKQLIWGSKIGGSTTTGTSWRSINCRRLRGFNAPTDPGNHTVVGWLWFALYSQNPTDMVPTSDPGPFAGGPLTMRDVNCEDCEFYGGNGGIQVLGSGTIAGGAYGTFPAAYPAGSPQWPGGYNPAWIDNITMSRCRHEMTVGGKPVASGDHCPQRRIYLSAPMLTTDTTVNSNELADYPTLRSGETFTLTCFTAGTGAGQNLPQLEVMTVTAHTFGQTTATVTRGGTPLAFAAGDWGTVPAYGANFQLGSSNQGGYCKVRECHAIGSGDVTFELDTWQTLVVEDSTSTDGQGSGMYITNYANVRYPASQRTTYRRVRVARHSSNMGYGFSADTNSSTIPLGAITYDDCHYYRNPALGATTPANPYHTAEFGGYAGNDNSNGGGLGAANSAIAGGSVGSLVNEGWRYWPAVLSGPLTLQNCSAIVEGVTVSQSYNATEIPVNIGRFGTRKLTIRNLYVSYSATGPGGAGSPCGLTLLNLGCADHTWGCLLDIEGVVVNLNLTSWPTNSFAIGVRVGGSPSGTQSWLKGKLFDVAPQPGGTGASASGGNMQLMQFESSTYLNAGVGKLIVRPHLDGSSSTESPTHNIAQYVNGDAAVKGWTEYDLVGGGFRTYTSTTSTQQHDQDIVLDATSGGFTLTVVGSVIGKRQTFYRKDTTANTVTLAPSSGSIIVPGGASVSSLAVTGTATLEYDGTNWILVAGGVAGRTAVSASYTVLPNDRLVAVDTAGAAYTQTLPLRSTVELGHVVTIKDETGHAATNNITVSRQGASDTIDGATTVVINTNYGFAQFYATPSGWGRIT